MSIVKRIRAWWHLSAIRRASLTSDKAVDEYNAAVDRYNAEIDRGDANTVFVVQLDRKIHEMWHAGESCEAALAEARDRMLTFGGIKPYLGNRFVAWATRRGTERTADGFVRDAYRPRGCTPGQPPCGPDARTCCGLHGRNCEPPSELCCHDCTEARHAGWTDERGVSRFGHPSGEMCSNPDLSPDYRAT